LLLLAILMPPLAGILASSHPATAALHLMIYLAVGVVLLVCQGYAVYRSSKRTSPRPRQQYFLFCAGYLVS
jgi:O-antigen/teichoic acid export membrane protein